MSDDLLKLIDELNEMMDDNEQPFLCDDDCSECLWDCDEYYEEKNKKKKCECGSDSVGSPRHSTWCVMYKED